MWKHHWFQVWKLHFFFMKNSMKMSRFLLDKTFLVFRTEVYQFRTTEIGAELCKKTMGCIVCTDWYTFLQLFIKKLQSDVVFLFWFSHWGPVGKNIFHFGDNSPFIFIVSYNSLQNFLLLLVGYKMYKMHTVLPVDSNTFGIQKNLSTFTSLLYVLIIH